MLRSLTDRVVLGGGRLRGEVLVPGDKSVSHRALMLGALAEGTTEISGLAPGSDVGSTRRILEDLGVPVTARGSEVRVAGRGEGGLSSPKGDLDAGNSGTTMRLMAGILAGCEFESCLVGDASLNRRPMERVAAPLRALGAQIALSPKGTAPMIVRGGGLRGRRVELAAASAQVKSAVLLAGLRAAGRTTVVEPAATRDHTEKMLELFGVCVRREGLSASVEGGARLRAARVDVPGDPSSAAFWVVAASLAPGSALRVPGIVAARTRTGFLDVLDRMGAEIRRTASPARAGEECVDLEVRAAPLRAADISSSEVPGLVDEVPILALAAALARGTSRFRGLGELRHKESDRLEGIQRLLAAFGARSRVAGDDLAVEGGARLHGAEADALRDHRLAMTACVAAFLAAGETTVLGADCADTSYPSFFDDLDTRRMS